MQKKTNLVIAAVLATTAGANADVTISKVDLGKVAPQPINDHTTIEEVVGKIYHVGECPLPGTPMKVYPEHCKQYTATEICLAYMKSNIIQQQGLPMNDYKALDCITEFEAQLLK